MEKLIERAKPIVNLFNNGEIYIVGGVIRDSLLGKTPKDIDFACSQNLDKITQKLKAAGFEVWKVDKDPQIVGAKLSDIKIEISCFKGANIKEDLLHRDFTINAMATKDGQIVDPYNGLKDIGRQIIKCTNSPSNSFSEDPLRMLRAIRFVSTLGFRIDEKTKNSIEAYAQSILITSKERWFEELTKLLIGSNVKPALELLFKTRLLGYVLPELYPITMIPRNQQIPTKDLWYHTKVVVNKSKATPKVRWAALLHDIAKPQTISESSDGTHFFQHEYLGAEIAGELLKRIRAGASFRRSVCGLIALHQRIGDVVSRRNDPPVSTNALRRLARDCEDRQCKLDDLIELFAADCSSGRKEVVARQKAHADLLRKALKEMKEEDLKPRLPKGMGTYLMEHFNLPPGPEVGKLKQRLDLMLLSGEIDINMSVEQMVKLLKVK
jgi:poly(A) polymerase